MAVNNYAPAEYGGYVLGANSGGGGGGLSEFDEFCGFTGSAHITLNLVLPEEDPGPFTRTYFTVTVSDREYTRKIDISFSDLHTNEIVVPISEGNIIEISAAGGVTSNGYYDADMSNATITGDLTRDEELTGVVVNGDGTITVEVFAS